MLTREVEGGEQVWVKGWTRLCSTQLAALKNFGVDVFVLGEHAPRAGVAGECGVQALPSPARAGQDLGLGEWRSHSVGTPGGITTEAAGWSHVAGRAQGSSQCPRPVRHGR